MGNPEVDKVPVSGGGVAPVGSMDTSSSAGAAASPMTGGPTLVAENPAAVIMTYPTMEVTSVDGASLEQMTIALRVIEGKEKISALLDHLASTNKPLHDAMIADALAYMAERKLLPARPDPGFKQVAMQAAPAPAPETDSLGQIKSDPYIPGPRIGGRRINT